MVGIIELSRLLIFGTSSFQIEQLVNGLITTIIFMLIGILSYNSVEKTFLDTVYIFMETVIKIENLYKEYRLGSIGYATLREDLQRILAELQGKPDPIYNRESDVYKTR